MEPIHQRSLDVQQIGVEQEDGMPLYEYECDECGEQFVLLRPFSKRDDPAKCSVCGSESCEPIISVFAASSSGCGDSGSGFT